MPFEVHFQRQSNMIRRMDRIRRGQNGRTSVCKGWGRSVHSLGEGKSITRHNGDSGKRDTYLERCDDDDTDGEVHASRKRCRRTEDG
jgi:hypothetical protein